MAKFTVSNQVAKGVAVTAISRAGMLLLAIMVSLRVNLGTGDSASNTLGSPTLGVTSRRMKRWPSREKWRRQGKRVRNPRN